MIIIVNPRLLRLCNDGKWRSHANFGGYPSCVKTYKTLGGAKQGLTRLKRKGVQAAIVHLDEPTLEIDAAGQIIRRVPSETPGYERIIRADINEFIVVRNYEPSNPELL